MYREQIDKRKPYFLSRSPSIPTGRGGAEIVRVGVIDPRVTGTGVQVHRYRSPPGDLGRAEYDAVCPDARVF